MSPSSGRAFGHVLTPRPTPVRELIAQTWASRELIGILARKEFFVRYRRASFGVLWAGALPVLQAVVLAIVFLRIVHIRTGVNYTVFVFAGLTVWSFFSSALTAGSTAIVDSSAMTSRIYFPRAVLPIASVVANVYGLAITVVILLAMALAFGVGLGPAVLWLIPGTILVIVLTALLSLVFAAVHVYFRDVRYLVQAGLVVFIYVSPVLYPLRLAPHVLRVALNFNPVTGPIELFRAGIAGADPGWHTAVWVSLAWVAGLSVVVLALHRHFDRVFSDLL